MSIKLNEKGYSHARSAAESGDTTDAPWEAPNGSARKENECLGVDTSEPEGSAARLKYPVFSGGKLNWNAVHAAESRATQNGASAVAEAAKKLAAMRKKPVAASANAIILDGHEMKAAKPVPLGLEGRPMLREGRPVYFRRKEVARVGEWTHRGTGEKFTLDKDRLDAWARNTNALIASGVRPYVPNRHRTDLKADDLTHVDAGDNYGFVLQLSRDGDSLYADLELVGEKALDAIAANCCSVYVVNEALDAKGNKYGESLQHLAIVPNPALPNLGPFVSIAASADSPAREIPVYVLSASSTRRNPMNGKTIQELRAKFGWGSDVTDDQVAEKAAEKALALSADVVTLTTERNTLRSERDTLQTKNLELAAGAPKQPDPLLLSMFADNIAAKRELAVSSGALTEAEAKMWDALLNDAAGKPTALALSACGTSGKPLAFQAWDLLGKLSHNGLRVGNAAPRGATVAEPALTLSADGQPVQKEMTPERLKELLSQTNTGRAILADAAKK